MLAIRPLYGLAGFTSLPDMTGAGCTVWKSPQSPNFSIRLARGTADTTGLRAILTAEELHGGTERKLGINGIRQHLRPASVVVNEEAVAFPTHFPWVLPMPTAAVAKDVE